MVAGIVGAGHLAALQRKTWLLREFADAHKIDVRVGVGWWLVDGSSKARPGQFNSMR